MIRIWISRATAVSIPGQLASQILLGILKLPSARELARRHDGLSACAIVAADVVSAKLLPRNVRPFVIRLISDSSLASLQKVSQSCS